jgi:hypothetical protein
MKSRFLSNINCLEGLGFETEGCGYTLAWAHAVTALAESRPVPKAMEIEPEGAPGRDHAQAGLPRLSQKSGRFVEAALCAGRVNTGIAWAWWT